MACFRQGMVSGSICILLLLVALGVAGGGEARAAEEPRCVSDQATQSYRAGFEAQRELRTADALVAYRECLKLEPNCVPCQYEMGWSYWSRSQWNQTVRAWERTLKLDPHHTDARSWLPRAREYAHPRENKNRRVPMGTRSRSADGAISLELVARFQNYNSSARHPNDHHDPDIFSPKSVRFSRDGKKVYVNSLEGSRTVVYDPNSAQKVRTIEHQFTKDEAALFQGQSTVFGYKFLRRPRGGSPNEFSGKPVESELSHRGKYLWVPYYRRSFDPWGTSPSAVAIVNTETDRIVRIMPTGPIPKYIVASPDSRWVAIVHWGDNTVGLIDASSGDPARFEYVAQLVVERPLPLAGLKGVNRDEVCGFCLRGTVFTPDGRTLLVARMGDGGIAGFDVESRLYRGTVLGMKPTPRHLVLSPDGRNLYVSSNVSGYVSRIALDRLLDAFGKADGKRAELNGWEEIYVGGGARTIQLSPDGRYLFAAVNLGAYLVVVDTKTFQVAARARTDSYPVGLDVSPDGHQVWVTSQGSRGIGGNSVCVFKVTYSTPRGVESGAEERVPEEKLGKGGGLSTHSEKS